VNLDQEYRRLRAKGWAAKEAKRTAKVNVAFAAYEARGLVKIEAEPDECAFIEDVMGDYSDLDEDQRQEYRADDYKTAYREGIWVYFTSYRVSENAAWQVADSIGACVGRLDDSYGEDLRKGALDALDAAFAAEAEALQERGTYAAGGM
jgi:hypothetical protein